MGNTCTNCHACKGDGGEVGELQTSVSAFSDFDFAIDIKTEASRHRK
jgi:hypothetical protein